MCDTCKTNNYHIQLMNSGFDNYLFRIKLPDNIEQLDLRLSSKGRYNIRREKRLVNDSFGDYQFVECMPNTTLAGILMESYLEFKMKTYGKDYGLNLEEYCKKYHVSKIYGLLLGEEKIVGAVLLSCEQCPCVYLENLSYNPDLSKYSLGKIIYDEYLKSLVEKEYKELFLNDGDYSYKKRYGSIQEHAWTCDFTRINPFFAILKNFKHKILDTILPTNEIRTFLK